MFEIISAIIPNPKIFYSVAAAVNPNGTKTLLTDGVRTFFINGKPVVINGL